VTRDEIAELIHRRRRQILVHSILYYKRDRPLIADHTYDQWAQELIRLQREHPEISEGVDYHLDAFRAFTSSTGFNLPLDDPRANNVADELLKHSERQS
jgi:hypothetical protein